MTAMSVFDSIEKKCAIIEIQQTPQGPMISLVPPGVLVTIYTLARNQNSEANAKILARCTSADTPTYDG